MSYKSFLVLSFAFLTFASCKRDPLAVDITNSKVSISYLNMDSLLYATPQDELLAVQKKLIAEVNELYEYQIGYCMRIGRVEDTAFVNSIMLYRQDPNIQQLEKEIATKFNNLSNKKEAITTGFRHLKAHLSNVKIPTYIVFQNSLFNSSAFCTEKEIGIGLDQYLGPESPTVQSLPGEPFYDWMKKGWDAQYMERDALLSWILTHVVEETKGNLAEQMINYGKAIYLTEAAFPKAEKNTIMRYSKEHLQWALDNEYSFWKYLVDENMLFKTNERNATNLFSEGPFTPGLPEKGPDRLGQFLGWRIVKNYMEKTKTTFEELIHTPFNEILQKYEP
jgi:hypothetical protein